MKIIKYLLIVTAFIISAVAVASQFADKYAVKGYINQGVCSSALNSVATKPSSLEIHSIETNDSNLSIQEAKDWIENKYSSQNLIESMTKIADEKYSNNSPMKTIFVSIDYTAEESVYGPVRSNFLCVFTIDVFDNNHLESITYHNKDYTDLQSVFLMRDKPKRLNSTLMQVDEESFIDRLKYIISKLIFTKNT